jgi:hypothetical protein
VLFDDLSVVLEERLDDRTVRSEQINGILELGLALDGEVEGSCAALLVRIRDHKSQVVKFAQIDIVREQLGQLVEDLRRQVHVYEVALVEEVGVRSGQVELGPVGCLAKKTFKSLSTPTCGVSRRVFAFSIALTFYITQKRLLFRKLRHLRTLRILWSTLLKLCVKLFCTTLLARFDTILIIFYSI